MPRSFSFAFLARFALIAGLLFLAWGYLEGLYTASLLPLVNNLFAHQGVPAEFQQHQHRLLLSCQLADGTWRPFQFKGHDLIYLNTLVALALFASLPGASWCRKLRWAGPVVLLLWLTHAFALYAGGYSALQDCLELLPPGQRQDLLATTWRPFSVKQASFFSQLVGLWSIWGSPALVLLAWVFASPYLLRSDQEEQKNKKRKTTGKPLPG